MVELTFKEDSHEYWLGDKKLPSVTEILKDVGVIDDRFYTPESAARGKLIHKALELMDRGSLNWGNLDPQFYPYLEAWQSFKKDYDITEFETIESPQYHKFYLLAGTPDRT